MTEVYLVLFDWATEDDGGVDSYVFANYDDAVKKFKAIIEAEMTPALSWVGDEAFNSAGKLNKNFILHKFTDETSGKDLFWQVADYNHVERYSFVDLLKREIL